MLGLSLDTIFLYTLVGSGIAVFVLLLFHDVFSGIGIPDFLNPTLIVAFLAISSACGYLLIKLTNLHTGLILLISAVTALTIVMLLHLFVLVPVSMAQESLTITESDLKGRVGKVITSVPTDGYGEVLISSKSGTIAKPAVSFDNESIPAESEVLIIDIKNGVLQVSPQKKLLDIG